MAESRRERILSAAEALLARGGITAAGVRDVASGARVRAGTVVKVVGDQPQLLREVLARRDGSRAASVVADAVENPSRSAAMATLLQAGHEVFVDPRSSWDPIELEALALAALDPQLEQIGRARIAPRARRVRDVVQTARATGGVHSALTDDVLVHLVLALSVGMAMLDPVSDSKPGVDDWDAMLARVGSAVEPEDLLLEPRVRVSSRWRLRVQLPRRPGSVAALSRALAHLHAYTLLQIIVGQDDESFTIDTGVIAPESVRAETILAAARSVGTNAHITTGHPLDGLDGLDALAVILDGATHVVKDPEQAPAVAAILLAADGYEVVDAATGEADEAGVLRLQWTTHRHVLIRRDWAPFLQVEQARASALLRLSNAVATLAGEPDRNGWIESIRDGTVWIRLARPEDAARVAEMHDRTSELSRFQRYFAHREWRDIQLRRLSGGHRGATLVAMSRDGDIVALGNVFPVNEGASAAEIALLVEDAFQGKGLGRVLLARMVQVARSMGFDDVVADVLADNTGMLRLLDTTGLAWTSTTRDGVRTLRAPLRDPEAFTSESTPT